MTDVTDLPERFLVMLNGGRTPKHTIDDADYALMMMRMIRAWERRVISNPEMLAHNAELTRRLGEVANVAIAANAERFHVDERRGASMLECARILGIGKAAASERRARGVEIMRQRVADAGVVQFSEAKREREALADAHDRAVVELDAYRARHRAAGE